MAKVEHSDLVQHQVGIVQQFRKFWMDHHLCDVVLQSSDGAEHRAHVAVLSAASTFFKTLLGGAFLEADRVQRGKPVEIAASKAAVSALLDYIYGGQPEVQLDAGLELLRLAEAYSLPKLAAAIEAGFRASLHSNSALQILQEGQGLHALKVACEEKVAEDFENCSQHADFGKLQPGQLARILKREDLCVSLGKRQCWRDCWIGSKSQRTEMLPWACCCNMWISNQFRLRICFDLAVSPFLVQLMMICSVKLMKPCEFGNGRELKAHQFFNQRGAVCNIGHQIWVPALTLQGPSEKWALYPATPCGGMEVLFMPQTSTVESFVWNLVIQLPIPNSLWGKASGWLASKTWGRFLSWLLHPLERSLLRMLRMRGWSVFKTNLDVLCFTICKLISLYFARPTECCTWWGTNCRSWWARCQRL